MVALILLLMVSLAGVGAALSWPAFSGLMMVAGPAAIASLFLVVGEALRRGRPPGKPGAPARAAKRGRLARSKSLADWVVVDGSNVMYWKDGTPQIEPVREVLAMLAARGFTAGVVFDANAGYLVSGHYQHHEAFAEMVGLPEDRVMVVPKGSPADSTVLAAARDLGARIVTNDRYREWVEDHPEVREPGRLIRGAYRNGALWLELEEALRPARARQAEPAL